MHVVFTPPELTALFSQLRIQTKPSKSRLNFDLDESNSLIGYRYPIPIVFLLFIALNVCSSMYFHVTCVYQCISESEL